MALFYSEKSHKMLQQQLNVAYWVQLCSDVLLNDYLKYCDVSFDHYQNEVYVYSHKRQKPFHTVLQSVQSHSVKLVLPRATAFFHMIQLDSCTKVPQITHIIICVVIDLNLS